MIKSIKVNTSTTLNHKELGKEFFNLEQKFINENIALCTTAFENILLANKISYVPHAEGFDCDRTKVELVGSIKCLIFNRNSADDLIKALKDGDVAAKKRLLKELEEL